MTSREDRFASIGGALTRKPAVRAAPNPPKSTPPVAPADVAGEATSARPRSARRTAQPKPVTKRRHATGSAKRMSFRFNEDLFQALDARARADGTSRVHVVLDAIEQTVGDDMVGEFGEDSQPMTGLFVRPRTPGVRPTVACELAVNAGTVATIDELAATHQAPTRTAFVVRCITRYLGLHEN